MPLSRPWPCLLIALLLAALVLPALCRADDSQEAATAASGDTPITKADNATEWDIPPEVEALFPKNAWFDEKTWRIIKNEHDFTHRGYNRRVKLTHRSEDPWDVCDEFLENYNLFGGTYKIECREMIINESNPNKSKYSLVEWENIDPRSHVDLIKKIYISMQLRSYYQYPDGVEHLWIIYAPIIRRLLEENDGITMQKASVDIDGDGNLDELYKYALHPYNSCWGIDDREGYYWNYYLSDKSKYSKCYNEELYSLDPFYYKEKLYFAGDDQVRQPYFIEKDNNVVCGSYILCRFIEDKRQDQPLGQLPKGLRLPPEKH